MSHYLEIAAGLWSWLAGLQIKQKTIFAKVASSELCFDLEHPVQGLVQVRQPFSAKNIFSAHGIALQVVSQAADRAELEVYDRGGIFDPIDGRVQGEHYSATHFALLSAILFSETGEEKYLSAAKLAIEFHLRTSPTEYAPISSWMYHWDFQNYALILSYRLLKDCLTGDESAAWERGILSMKTNHKNKLTNWAAMRAWAFAERAELFGSRIDSLKMRWNLRDVKKARHSDGCFDDDFNRSRPLQYHLFTIAILHRLWLIKKDEVLKNWIEGGVDYLLPFIDPEGDFNYLGRGQEQIFGSAAAIYVLEAAYQVNGNVEMLRLARLVSAHLAQFKRGEYFPLVLNDRPDEERNGWYDYHHLTVYNAFLGAWLGLAHLLKNPRVDEIPKPRHYFSFSDPTRVAVVAKENYFVAFYGGLPEYSSEGGVTPYHLWWRDFGVVFSCPGAPSPERFSRLSPTGGEQNFLSPIATNGTGWIIPIARTSEKFFLSDSKIEIEYDCGPFAIHRKVEFGLETLRFQDSIHFSDVRTFDDFRIFNFPVPADKLEIEIIDDKRVKLKKHDHAILLEVESGNGSFELLPAIPSARGALRPLVKRRLNFQAQKDQNLSVSFSFRMI